MNEIIMVPDGYGRNNNSSNDSALLYSLMSNNGGFNNGNWMWMMFMWFLEPLMFGNGYFRNGGFGGANGFNSNIDSIAGREMLNQAIQGNTTAIQNLANMFNTSIDFVKQAICGIDKSLAQLGGQVGLTGEQVKNAVIMGDQQIRSELASCCCTIREAVTTGNYQNQIATLQQTQLLSDATRNVGDKVTQGFCDTAYATREQTCQLGQAIQGSTQVLKDATSSQTQAILAKLDNMEKTGLLDKIDAQRETISLLRTKSDIKDQNFATQQAIASAVAPLTTAIAEIRCAQPNTVTVPYYPFQITPRNSCGNGCGNSYGNSCGNGCGCNCQNQFWY